MTWLDVFVVAVIALSTVLSLFRGVVKEVLSLAVWVLAFWLAFHYSFAASRLLEGMIPYESVRLGAAFLLIFIAILLAGMLASSLVSRLVQAGGLGIADRALGAVFGALRGVVVVAVLVMLASLTPLAQAAAWKQSQLVGYFELLSDWATDGLGGTVGDIAGSIAPGAGNFVDRG
jgi:membrane protein required for colicin V production